jgi:hypothetical protein
MASEGALETKYTVLKPRPEYPAIHECQVFDFLQAHGMKASFKPAHKRDARRFATLNIPHYEAFEACVESLVTGEGMVAIRFKPRLWAPLVRFGLKTSPRAHSKQVRRPARPTRLLPSIRHAYYPRRNSGSGTGNSDPRCLFTRSTSRPCAMNQTSDWVASCTLRTRP